MVDQDSRWSKLCRNIGDLTDRLVDRCSFRISEPSSVNDTMTLVMTPPGRLLEPFVLPTRSDGTRRRTRGENVTCAYLSIHPYIYYYIHMHPSGPYLDVTPCYYLYVLLVRTTCTTCTTCSTCTCTYYLYYLYRCTYFLYYLYVPACPLELYVWLLISYVI